MTASTANFFIAGGTLHTNAASYVTRQADRELYEALQSGMFAYVLTSRQMGKSSLMVRTARQFRSEGNLVAVVDMTALGQNATVEQWYFTLTECIARQLGSPSDKWEPLWNSAERSAFQHWVQFIEQLVERSKHRIIIFIDEIDLVQTLPFSTDEFFAAIRQFYNRRPIEPKFERLTFCLLGVAAPSDLIRDPRLTPFNIGVRIELTDFSIDEAAVLASGLGDGSQAEARFRRVLYWTGGHPYLTQRLCQSLSTRNRDSDVDSTCANIYFGTRAREQDDNLLFVRERLIRSREDVPALLKLYSNVLRHKPVRDEEANPLVTELRLSGICKSRAGILSVRNRIYSHVFDNAWVKSSMPDAEVRRQRAAFRKGALLASAVALAVILTITGLALTILRQRNENRWQLYIADISLAQQAWAHHNPYRAIELLEQHVPKSGDRDLRGFEWYMVRNLCSSRKPVHTIDVGDDAYVAVASPDASHVYAITVHGQLIDFDAASGTRLHTATNREDVRSLAISHRGTLLATASTSGNLTLWSAATLQPIASVSAVGILGQPNFSPDDRELID
ncbi:MAG TPA: AAA-like domain-containing protein, partial [Terriglobales bacterium]|nr:AAA-like domain-containing protein [Terriglobales bacterium]